ncbi:MAG: hypothetical protein KDJ41_15990 [Hyphomicrobiaceae bacterium]|nr:hypothetical protein [Hyphomicrobiaceae bacterium]
MRADSRIAREHADDGVASAIAHALEPAAQLKVGPHGEQARHPTLRAHTPARRIGARLAWGLGGFVIGIVCWHLVGFWTFVTATVLHGPEIARKQPSLLALSETRLELSRTTPSPTAPTQAQPVGACTHAVVDRASRIVALVPCQARTFRTGAQTPASKGDQLVITAQR